MRSIEELLKNNIDRSDMTEEEEYAFVEYWFKKYAEGGFCETFQSPFDIPDKDKPYVGKPFKVICECDTETVDLECLPMWGIELEDGHIMNAYPEEICLLECDDTSDTCVKTSAGVITTQAYDDGIAKGIKVLLNDDIICIVDVFEEAERRGETRVITYKEDNDEPSDRITVRPCLKDIKTPKIIDARLLSLEEALALPEVMRVWNTERYGEWWLQGCGPSYEGYAYSVTKTGRIQFSLVDEQKYIRPALKIDIKNTPFKVGDNFMFGGKEFKIISPDLAWMTDGNLGCLQFNEDWRAPNANIYECSKVKTFVDEWFDMAKRRT